MVIEMFVFMALKPNYYATCSSEVHSFDSSTIASLDWSVAFILLLDEIEKLATVAYPLPSMVDGIPSPSNVVDACPFRIIVGVTCPYSCAGMDGYPFPLFATEVNQNPSITAVAEGMAKDSSSYYIVAIFEPGQAIH